MIAAVVLGPLLHWLEIALACLGHRRHHHRGTDGAAPLARAPGAHPRPVRAMDAAAPAAPAVPRPRAAASGPGRRPAPAHPPRGTERRGARRGDAPAARRSTGRLARASLNTATGLV